MITENRLDIRAYLTTYDKEEVNISIYICNKYRSKPHICKP